jgi:transcriptional regulator with XRE-family HTH domain
VKNDLAKVQRFIGRRIAELRVQRSITQEQLAEESDVDARYIQRIEAGEINITVETLVRLANVLRVGVAEIFAPPRAPTTRTRSTPAGELRNASGHRKK